MLLRTGRDEGERSEHPKISGNTIHSHERKTYEDNFDTDSNCGAATYGAGTNCRPAKGYSTGTDERIPGENSGEKEKGAPCAPAEQSAAQLKRQCKHALRDQSDGNKKDPSRGAFRQDPNEGKRAGV